MGVVESAFLWGYDYKWVLQINIAVIFLLGYLAARSHLGLVHVIIMAVGTVFSTVILVPMMLIRFAAGVYFFGSSEGLGEVPLIIIHGVLSVAAVGFLWWAVINGFRSSTRISGNWELRKSKRRKQIKRGRFAIILWVISVVTGASMIIIG